MDSLVLVCGGRRGVGTSTVAALLALAAADAGGDVLLVDCAGSLSRLFALPSAADTGSDDPLAWITPHLAVLDAGGTHSLPLLLAPLRAHFDLIVVDGGWRMGPCLEVAAAGIDRLYCVTTTDGVASAGAYAMLKVLSSRFPGIPAGVLVNRAPVWAAVEIDHQFRHAVSRFLRRDLDVVTCVPMDECLRAGVAAGLAFHEVACGSPAAHVLFEIADRLRTASSQRMTAAAYAPRLPRRS